MKYPALFLASALTLSLSHAEIVLLDLSPPGYGEEPGLSPANEISPATGTGSGDAVFTGIQFDTATRTLMISAGYGSFAGFTDLTGPATAAHLHGPAPFTGNAGVLRNFVADGQHLPAPIPAEGGIIVASINLTADEADDLLDGLHYINIHTAANPGGELRGQLIPQENSAPTITCPDPIVAECESEKGAWVSVPVTVRDEDGDPLVVNWKVNGVEIESVEIPSGGEVTEELLILEDYFDLGVHAIEVCVSDGKADFVSCETTVTVEDTIDPVVKKIEADPNVLWPPNHKMVPVTVKLDIEDACGHVASRIVKIESNEAVDATGSGNTAPDWRITGNLTAELRAERAGPGNGRIYTLTVDSTDRGGNSVTSTVVVTVPHDQGGPVVEPEPSRGFFSRFFRSRGRGRR